MPPDAQTMTSPISQPLAPDPAPDRVHSDMLELTGAVRELAETLKPLKALADHVPALVEMAQVWNATKSSGRVVGQFGQVTAEIAKWISAMAIAVATVWFTVHARWDLILKGVQP